MGDVLDDPRLSIGGNNPPEPTPFEQSRDEIEGLFEEATHWLDGEAIETHAQADSIAKLMTLLRAAAKKADERRVEENEPFDKGKAEVQARYNPLIAKAKGKTDMALDACKRALAPYLAKLEAEKQAAARKAREEAEAKQRAAEEAMRASNAADAENLAARARAEELAEAAKRAAAAASRAEKDKAHAHGGGRAITMRTVYSAEITDSKEFARHVWLTYGDDLNAFLAQLADRLVRNGVRGLPGVTVHEQKVAV